MKRYRHKRELRVLAISATLSAIILVASIFILIFVDDLTPNQMYPLLIIVFLPILVNIYHFYISKKVEKTFLEVSEDQFPDIYDYLVEASSFYQIKVPKAYVSMNPSVNPCAHDFALRPYVLIGTDFYAGCRENSTSDALKFMVAHQVAHIAADHGKPYWYVLGSLILNIPVLKGLLIHSQEFTADKAAFQIAPKGAIDAINLCTVGKDNYVYGNSKIQVEKAMKKKGIINKMLYIFTKYPSYILRIGELEKHKL